MKMDRLERYFEENYSIHTVNSVEECLHVFGPSGHFYPGWGFFRGQSNVNYELTSTLDRFKKKEKPSNEKLLIRQFKKIANNYLSSEILPKTSFEWLSLMQHYGIPTRLLDVTSSPFIALYFAVKDWENEADAVVWSFSPNRIHECSLNRLKTADFPLSIPERPYGGYGHLPEFLSNDLFDETFMTGKYKVAMILEPERAEKRLSQQQGAFLVTSGWELSTQEVLFDVMFDEDHLSEKTRHMKGRLDGTVGKVVISGRIKEKVFRTLLNMNINASTLFPDIYGAAQYVTETVKVFEYIANRWNLK